MTARLIRYVWAAPWTAVAGALTPLVRLSGGRARMVAGVLELEGGFLPSVLRRLPPGGVAAITIGHVVLGRDAGVLDLTRAHERVHVEQFERWGPLFPLAYGLASLAAWGRGGDYYRDNRFEVEARRQEG